MKKVSETLGEMNYDFNSSDGKVVARNITIDIGKDKGWDNTSQRVEIRSQYVACKDIEIPAFASLTFEKWETKQDGQDNEFGEVQVYMTREQLTQTMEAAQKALDTWNDDETAECARE
jgi:hypothetical protein